MSIKSKHNYILVIVTILYSCNHKSVSRDTQAQLVPDSTIYEVVNFILNKPENDISSCDKVVEKDMMATELLSNDSLELIEMDSLFSKDDIDFIYDQRKLAKDFRLRKKFVHNLTIIPFDTLYKLRGSGNKTSSRTFWENYYNKYGESGFCSLSLPLFSKDKSVVIVKYSWHCGSLCGYGSTNIYQKKYDGEWILIKTLDRWIS